MAWNNQWSYEQRRIRSNNSDRKHMNNYLRYYDKHIDCDWCGRQTRGRIYEGRTDVKCGSCHKELKTLNKREIVILRKREAS